MSRDKLIAEAPFDYRSTKSGLTQISCCGKTVLTLSGRESSRFVTKIERLSAADAQLLMAKATGHFKHGTERTAKNLK